MDMESPTIHLDGVINCIQTKLLSLLTKQKLFLFRYNTTKDSSWSCEKTASKLPIPKIE